MITVQVGYAIPLSYLSNENFHLWVNTALADRVSEAELCIRIIDEAEMTELNGNYRQKFEPTNVLAFPAEIPDEVGLPLLGDIAICAPIVEGEADEQGKAKVTHWAHMVVHGCLHLIGYDHIDESEAAKMESLETEILKRLGYANPYIQNDKRTGGMATAQ